MSKLGVQKRRGLRREAVDIVIGKTTVKGKICADCLRPKSLDDFGNEAKGYMGKKTVCKECYNYRCKKYKEENATRIREWNREYRDSNKDKISKWYRDWSKRHPEVLRLIKQRRRARKKLLPSNLTNQQTQKILFTFENKCSLTEDTDVQLDHFIPLAIGHGGTTLENIIPLAATLNASKSDKNPFVWYVEARQRFGLSDEKWRLLIEYLANINETTTFEYAAYVYECFSNPNEIGNRLESA